MNNTSRHLYVMIGGFLLFCLDRFLKYLSLYIFTEKHLLTSAFGWNPFKNTGIAFSLPVPTNLAILISIPILIIIAYFLFLDYQQKKDIVFNGLVFLFFGALSNLIDRILYSATIDYCLLGTGIINLADVFICFGIYSLFKNKKKNYSYR